MQAVLHQVISGLATGVIYGSMALALVMVYQATRHLNFAQGEMAMVSTYFAWALIAWGLPYWVAFLLTIVASFGFGVVLERTLLRPLTEAPALAHVMVTIGLFFICNSAAGWIFTYTLKVFPSPFPETSVFGGLISAHELGALCVMGVVLALLTIFFRFNKLGLAMRAAAHNPVSSRLAGIRVDWMLSLGWGLAAVIGSVGGMMVAPILFLDPGMMGGVLIYAFAAALLGGISSPPGAVLGGFIVGIIENLAGAYVVGTELKLSLALIIIVVVLILRPQGLIGKQIVTRV